MALRSDPMFQSLLEQLAKQEAELATVGATRGPANPRVTDLTAERAAVLSRLSARAALITGFALAFARAIGEYGSVIFIAGNMPMISEITPLLIITKLEQYDYAGATAIAVVMLVVSFALLLGINLLQAWSRRRTGAIG